MAGHETSDYYRDLKLDDIKEKLIEYDVPSQLASLETLRWRLGGFALSSMLSTTVSQTHTAEMPSSHIAPSSTSTSPHASAPFNLLIGHTEHQQFYDDNGNCSLHATSKERRTGTCIQSMIMIKMFFCLLLCMRNLCDYFSKYLGLWGSCYFFVAVCNMFYK